MAAPTEDAARETFLHGDFGNPHATDGRNSVAMLDMMVGFWRLKAAGHDVAIHPFLWRWKSRIPRRDQAWWELEMAYGISRALAARPDARIVVFVGDLHARKKGYAFAPDIGVPAAGHLHASGTFALHTALQGGESWSCQPTCGVQTSRGRHDAGPDIRGMILGPIETGPRRVLAVGPTTASPPAGLQPSSATISSGSRPLVESASSSIRR